MEPDKKIWECKYCGVLKQLVNKWTKSSHLQTCDKWNDWKNKIITKEFLEKEYIENKKSLPEIASQLGLESTSVIHKSLKKFLIKPRNISESFPISDIKRKNTCLKKYGAEHVFSNNSSGRNDINNKIILSTMDKYGVVNVFQAEEIKEKIKKFYLEKYGVESPSQVPEIRQKQINTIKERYGINSVLELAYAKGVLQYTKPHKIIMELLKNLEFDPRIEKPLNINNKQYFFDIHFPDIPEKLIEVNGDYYHANPIFYKENDIIPFFKKEAKYLWEKDKAKKEAAESFGYKVLTIWENDIYKNKEKVIERLKEFLK